MQKCYSNEEFLTKLKNGNTYTLCHNFWTYHHLDLFSSTKWPSESQFCSWWKMAKNGQKMAIYQQQILGNSLNKTIKQTWHWNGLHSTMTVNSIVRKHLGQIPRGHVSSVWVGGVKVLQKGISYIIPIQYR